MEDPVNTPADVLTPYTVRADTTRAYQMCWLNYEALEPGTASFVDSKGMVVCTDCARHCASCADPDCDHPQYVLANQG
jgi:hypothetical protein